MDSVGSFDTKVTSNIRGPSRLEIFVKYVLHGFVFGVAFQLLPFGVFFLMPLEYFFGIIGGIIISIVVLLALPWVNADICTWLWYFKVQRDWLHLLGHGVLLYCTLLVWGLVTGPLSLFLFAALPYEQYLAVILGIGIPACFIVGYTCKSIGYSFRENR